MAKRASSDTEQKIEDFPEDLGKMLGSPVSPPTEWGEARVHRRDRLGGVVHEYVLAA
jgi:hypothetical protein